MKLERRSGLGVLAAALLAGAVASEGACGGSGSSASTGTGGSTATTESSATATSSATGVGGGSTSTTSSSSSGAGGGVVSMSSKVDLLLMIDNSRSMADKQVLLAGAIPNLVTGLVNPACVDSNGKPAAMQPAGPLDACPGGTTRVHAPVLDLHLGVVTSSLGGHGADSCQPTETFSCNGSPNPSNNDAGHLISRIDPCSAAQVATYQNQGFLAWDPAQKLMPPGEKDLGQPNGMTGLLPALREMVDGAGQIGCGYESQLESWYRFLVDPEPYQSITIDAQGKIVLNGVDNVVLQERVDFLRPSSLLAIVMLTDENDCSTKEIGQDYLSNQLQNGNKVFHLPRARQECAANPNDPCCASCGQKAPPGCPVDPMCASSPALNDLEDDINVRCWDQKRRFGIDFLYPIDRYTTALESAMVPDRQANLVPNPIFSDLNPSDGDSTIRDGSLVVLAGLVGVPWQDIARDSTDLTKGFRNATELSATDSKGHTSWDYILGDPAKYVAPLDPHMIESISPRSGTDPVSGVALAPPGSPPGADAINGHEYSIPKHDDLEYACVFDLTTPRDCSQPGIVSCDCYDPSNDNPLCDPNNKTKQLRAKAYPGLRELSLLESVGKQGVVTSICARQVVDPKGADYGYIPAMQSILAELGARLPK
jgi:hypothetical protein